MHQVFCLINMKTELQNLINDCKQELVDIEARINNLPIMDKGRQYLTNYALIKTCGTIEYTYKSIVADYFSQYSSVQIDRYLEKTLINSSRSAKYDMIRSLLDQFDSTWYAQFHAQAQSHFDQVTGVGDFGKLKSSLDSLVSNRHQFAHGRITSATFLDIKGYFQDAIEVLLILDSVVV